MVKAVRNAEKMLGKVDYELDEKRRRSREFSRSLFISEDVKKGDVLTEKNVRSVRPNFGMHTKYLKTVLGKKINQDASKGTPLLENLVDNFHKD
jgi:pseudaminic acid synthase